MQLGYLSADIICSEKRTISESIAQGKLWSMRNVHSFENWKYSQTFPRFSWEIFSHVMCLDQSHASESMWWIIILDVISTLTGKSRAHSSKCCGLALSHRLVHHIRVSLIVPFPLRQKCPRKSTMTMNMTDKHLIFINLSHAWTQLVSNFSLCSWKLHTVCNNVFLFLLWSRNYD